MKINVAKTSGFCFGVKRALKITHQTQKSKGKVYMLGNVVHNEDVIKKIKKLGIKKIKKLTNGKNKVLLIRAHGASRKTFRQAQRLGYKIVDATCPMVKEIHKIARDMERKGYKIIVIGDKRHDEVQGIIGQLKDKAMVIDSKEHLLHKGLKKIKKAAIVVQSTQNIEKVLPTVAILKRYITKLKFFNTICRPTRAKQQEIKTMPLMNNIMIIIGSKTSANTKRLYEISKALNRRSYWVQSKKELRPEWFKAAGCVGIAAGASTPGSTTQAVVNRIRRYF